MSDRAPAVGVYLGEALARYHFGPAHPFGPLRLAAFEQRLCATGSRDRVRVLDPVAASDAELRRFHTDDYLERVRRQSRTGHGYLDYGDTPAVAGIFEAASSVVGSSLDAARRIVRGDCRRAFTPIGGLHHAARGSAAGFCVFNDCGVVIEALRAEFGIRRIAYVDIDAHHGDGVYYAFESDPLLFIADIHEDGRYLYPGTGAVDERGSGDAYGTKLNLPLPPGADDTAFAAAWEQVERFVDTAQPEFILLQCGADSLRGDPITHLNYSAAAHAHAAARLARLADRHCGGRLLAFGGGGYDLDNLAAAWTAVVDALVAADAR